LSGSKPKARDQSSDKFLQRIAGKKALVPPPTPRPVIGEHPVRTLLRENADAAEEAEVDVTSAAATPAAVESPPPAMVASSAPSAEHVPPVPQPGVVVAAVPNAPTERVRPTKVAAQPAARRARPEGGDVGTPDPAGAEERVLAIRKKYRLNRGEFTLYRELYLMTHGAGKAECSFVVSELVRATGMLERRVRDNLRRLKKSGWLVLVEAYDFENRGKARYRVNVEPWG
jgi:hypothetical protein